MIPRAERYTGVFVGESPTLLQRASGHRAGILPVAGGAKNACKLRHSASSFPRAAAPCKLPPMPASPEDHLQRRLATILAADVVGYSRLMAEDEEDALHTLKAYRTVIDRLIARHEGRIFNTAGDSVLAEFGSAVEAVRCAITIQEELRVRNAERETSRRMDFRIGINVGDVLVDGINLYGDGVNVSARLESIAAPGNICISGSVYALVKNKLSYRFEDIGPQVVKNIPEPVPAFRLTAGDGVPQRRRGGNRLTVAAVLAAVLFIVGVAAFTLRAQLVPAPAKAPPIESARVDAAPAPAAGAPAKPQPSIERARNDPPAAVSTAPAAPAAPVAPSTRSVTPAPVEAAPKPSSPPAPQTAALPPAAGVKAFDGLWEFQLTGSDGCSIKTLTFQRKILNGVVMAPNNRVLGAIAKDGKFNFRNPSLLNRNAMVEAEGTISGETGEGSYHVTGTACHGSYKIHLLLRLFS